MRSLLWICLLSTLAACGSSGPKGRSLGGPPPGLDGFPAEVLIDDVFVEAKYKSDHSSRFGLDMIDRGILPLEIRVRLAGPTDRRVLLSSERLGLRLILQDGTVLPALEPAEVIERTSNIYTEKIRRYAYDPSLISQDSPPGFVFFDLKAAGKAKVSKLNMELERDGIVRTNRLDRSLISFTAVVDDDPQPFFVGIQR